MSKNTIRKNREPWQDEKKPRAVFPGASFMIYSAGMLQVIAQVSDFSVEGGGVVSFVSATGAACSSLLSLVEGFFPP